MRRRDARTTWLGIDVGGPRKGFDIALVDDDALLELRGGLGVGDVVALMEAARPLVVGIDSPCRCAPDGQTSRESERLLARAVCGIRWTPDEASVRGSDYYGWVVHGLALHDALAATRAEVIELFPTASWTRWHGARGGRSRSAWTRDGLRALGLAGVPERTNQDQRDAIAAAVTARLHTRDLTEMMGDIAIPATRTQPACPVVSGTSP